VSARELHMDTAFIPFHRPTIEDEELAAVREVLESKWLTTGPATVGAVIAMGAPPPLR
jgi:hypothetical protein